MKHHLMKHQSISVALLIFVSMLINPAVAAGPQYANDESQRIIEAMVNAHGGIERWNAAPAIRFDNVMHDNHAGRERFAWWVAHEEIDQKTRQVWQDWPMDDAQIGYDGEQVWSENWNRGNPSAMMVHFFYYFVNLPWLTQDDGVILSEATRFEWPGFENELYEIRMSYEEAPAIGKSSKSYYVLYIDPESYQLVGYQYASGYRPLLDAMGMPESKEVFGPMWRTIIKYEEVGGLLFPSAFHTSPGGPEGKLAGDHVILNIDVTTPFDYTKAAMSQNAVRFDGPLTTD
jgi:hypothetical protein